MTRVDTGAQSPILNFGGNGRNSVRSSTGIVYVIVEDGNGNIQSWKGNAQPPTSFTEQDAAGAPVNTNFHGASIAIDSADIIHVIYYDHDRPAMQADPTVRYATFHTADAAANQDTWQIDEAAPDLDDVFDEKFMETGLDIAIDTNDDPHIIWSDTTNNMGTGEDSAYYSNRIGGTWSSRILIAQTTNSPTDIVISVSIMIGIPTAAEATDRPICITNTQDGVNRVEASHGNVLDATSFVQATDITVGATNETQNAGKSSGAINDSGIIHWPFTEITSNDLMYVEHLPANSWTNWNTPVTIDSTSNWLDTTLAAVEDDFYLIVEKTDNNDLSLFIHQGSTYSEETTQFPEVGTFDNVRVKWSRYNNNEEAIQLDFVFRDGGSNVFWNEFPIGIGNREIMTVLRNSDENIQRQILITKLNQRSHEQLLKAVHPKEKYTTWINSLAPPIKNVDEDEEITEAINLALRRNVNEDEEISEAINLALRRTVNEDEEISEVIDNIVGKLQVIDEDEDITEAINLALRRNVDEDENITEAENHLLDLLRVIDETEEVNEAINLALRRTIDETANITEAINLSLRRTIDEDENITEAINQVVGQIRVVDETANITEDVVVVVVKAVNETEEIEEAINLALRRNISETEEIVEAINLALRRTVDETANITEDIVVVIGKTVDETVNIEEDENHVLGFIRVVDEDENITEAINVALRRTIDETANITESINLALRRNVDETENITEAINLALRKTITETANITETINLALRRTITETANITEAINLALRRTVDEDEEISEAENHVLGFVKEVPEDEEISEAINTVVTAQLIEEVPETEEVTEAINTVVAVAATGVNIVGTHAVPMIGRGERFIDVEYTFILKSCLVKAVAGQARFRSTIICPTGITAKLKSALTISFESQYRFKSASLIESRSHKSNLVSAILTKLDTTVILKGNTVNEKLKKVLLRKLKEMLDEEDGR